MSSVLNASSIPTSHSPVKWFRGGLVCKAQRLMYHSTLGSRAIQKQKKTPLPGRDTSRDQYTAGRDIFIRKTERGTGVPRS